jgi:hypothetical protein
MAKLTSTALRFTDSPVDEITTRTWIFPKNTAWIFFQASAPTGWTKLTTKPGTTTSLNDRALRVVSGSGGGVAGSNAFSSMMTSTYFNYAGNVGTTDKTGGHPLAEGEIPIHDHSTPSSVYSLSANPAVFNPDGSFNSWSGGDVGRPAPGGTGPWVRNTPSTGSNISPATAATHDHPVAATAPISVPISLAVRYIDVIVCSFDG